jgi:hypothetical protein
MKGLNLLLLIYMGSSFGKVVEGWAGIASGKFLCVANGAKLLYVVDVGSCASFIDIRKAYCHIKLLVQWPSLMLKGLAR